MPKFSTLAPDAEEDYVAVFDPVVATLDAKLAGRAQRVHRAGGDKLVDRGHLGADEMLLEVGVDLRGCHRRGRVAFAGPGPDLGFAGGEVGDETSDLPDRARDAAEARLVDAVAGPPLGLLPRLELGQLPLEPGPPGGPAAAPPPPPPFSPLPRAPPRPAQFFPPLR